MNSGSMGTSWHESFTLLAWFFPLAILLHGNNGDPTGTAIWAKTTIKELPGYYFAPVTEKLSNWENTVKKGAQGYNIKSHLKCSLLSYATSDRAGATFCPHKSTEKEKFFSILWMHTYDSCNPKERFHLFWINKTGRMIPIAIQIEITFLSLQYLLEKQVHHLIIFNFPDWMMTLYFIAMNQRNSRVLCFILPPSWIVLTLLWSNSSGWVL